MRLAGRPGGGEMSAVSDSAFLVGGCGVGVPADMKSSCSPRNKSSEILGIKESGSGNTECSKTGGPGFAPCRWCMSRTSRICNEGSFPRSKAPPSRVWSLVMSGYLDPLFWSILCSPTLIS